MTKVMFIDANLVNTSEYFPVLRSKGIDYIHMLTISDAITNAPFECAGLSAIVMDLQMNPELLISATNHADDMVTGFEVFDRHLKAKFPGVPVIFLSSRLNNEHLSTVRHVPWVHDILIRPVEAADLLSSINNLVALRGHTPA